MKCRERQTRSDIQETLEETAYIEITCAVKGYQKCRVSVDVGEEFGIFKKISFKGRAFKVTNARGQLGHLERANKKWITNKIESDLVRLRSI